jgi:hypothetical protein
MVPRLRTTYRAHINAVLGILPDHRNTPEHPTKLVARFGILKSIRFDSLLNGQIAGFETDTIIKAHRQIERLRHRALRQAPAARSLQKARARIKPRHRIVIV